jgi:hypothetical protein
VLGWLCHLCPNAREALAVRAETVNRAGNPGGYLVGVTLRQPVARRRRARRPRPRRAGCCRWVRVAAGC